uniref:Uncharacterized protein n=1 Tax=Syphacia muris TaxID=451379 RepID=A0A0N5AMX7_9BILA
MKIKIHDRLATLSSSRFLNVLSAEFSRLVFRRRKMLKELMSIYKIDLDVQAENRILPTECTCTSVTTIAGLHLPDPRSLIGHPEFETSTAAGYVVHFLIVVSQILNTSLRFPVVFQASRSMVINPITTEMLVALEGLGHLNGNIAQLRSDCGLGTPNKYSTLENLHSLIIHLTTEEYAFHYVARINCYFIAATLCDFCTAFFAFIPCL